MTEVKENKVKKSEDIEIAGTLFTVNSAKSDNAKCDISEILKKLILNNLDLIDKKCS